MGYEEDMARIAELEAEIAAIKQRLAEDPVQDQSTVDASATVDGSAFLSSELGATVTRSELHPEWVNVDFPLGDATGTKALAICYTMSTMIAAGGEAGFELAEGGARVARPGRVYVPVALLPDMVDRIEAIQAPEAKLAEPEPATP